jgi:hypothetical protein
LPRFIFFKFFFRMVVPSPHPTRRLSTGFSTIPLSLRETYGLSTQSHPESNSLRQSPPSTKINFQVGNKGGHISWW